MPVARRSRVFVRLFKQSLNPSAYAWDGLNILGIVDVEAGLKSLTKTLVKPCNFISPVDVIVCLLRAAGRYCCCMWEKGSEPDEDSTGTAYGEMVRGGRSMPYLG